MGVIKAADVRIEKAAPEGTATNEKQKAQDHDITPAAIAQAVATFTSGICALGKVARPIAIQIYAGNHIEVQLANPSDLERLPGEPALVGQTEKLRLYRVRKTVSGIDFITLSAKWPL